MPLSFKSKLGNHVDWIIGVNELLRLLFLYPQYANAKGSTFLWGDRNAIYSKPGKIAPINTTGTSIKFHLSKFKSTIDHGVWKANIAFWFGNKTSLLVLYNQTLGLIQTEISNMKYEFLQTNVNGFDPWGDLNQELDTPFPNSAAIDSLAVPGYGIQFSQGPSGLLSPLKKNILRLGLITSVRLELTLQDAGQDKICNSMYTFIAYIFAIKRAYLAINLYIGDTLVLTLTSTTSDTFHYGCSTQDTSNRDGCTRHLTYQNHQSFVDDELISQTDTRCPVPIPVPTKPGAKKNDLKPLPIGKPVRFYDVPRHILDAITKNVVQDIPRAFGTSTDSAVLNAINSHHSGSTPDKVQQTIEDVQKGVVKHVQTGVSSGKIELESEDKKLVQKLNLDSQLIKAYATLSMPISFHKNKTLNDLFNNNTVAFFNGDSLRSQITKDDESESTLRCMLHLCQNNDLHSPYIRLNMFENALKDIFSNSPYPETDPVLEDTLHRLQLYIVTNRPKT